MQESLGHKLRLMRAERGLSLREAARRAGVVKETISDIERGHTHPYDVTLAKLAKVYDVPLEELLEEPALAGKAEASRKAGLHSARVVDSLRDHAKIFRALADRLTSGLEQVRPEELPALVFESVCIANGASKTMAENVAPWLEGASPEELEAGQEAKRALEAIESAVYAISGEAQRHNAAMAAGVENELAAWRHRKKAG
jgi:transcriptional regulator with XRE-family HTH domain